MRSSYHYYIKEFGEPDYEYCRDIWEDLERIEKEIVEEQKD
jgi:hypothetical protein